MILYFSRSGIQETLHLARCAQEISRHYVSLVEHIHQSQTNESIFLKVMDMSKELEAAREDVARLTKESKNSDRKLIG